MLAKYVNPLLGGKKGLEIIHNNTAFSFANPMLKMN